MTRLHEAQQLVTGDWRPEHRPVHCTQCMFWLDGWSLEEGGEELDDERSVWVVGNLAGINHHDVLDGDGDGADEDEDDHKTG